MRVKEKKRGISQGVLHGKTIQGREKGETPREAPQTQAV